MKLQNQCCIFEQAKRLKELGVLQQSQFYHEVNQFATEIVYHTFSRTENYEYYSAFTGDELVVMCDSIHGLSNDSHYNPNKFYRQTKIDINNWDSQFTYYESFAHAMASKLIEIIEKGWESVEIINQRLSK